MLSIQSSSLWYANTGSYLRIFISKGVERIIQVKTCFLCRYALILVILRNNARFFPFLYSNFIIRFMAYKSSTLGRKSISVMLTILADKITVFFFHAFTKCARLRGSRDIVGLVGLASAIVPSCLRRSKSFFLSVSYVQNFFSLIFRGYKIFSRGYFVGLNFFSWEFRRSKILRFSINFSKKQKEKFDGRTLTEVFM